MQTAVAENKPRLVAKFAERFSVDPDKLLTTLKNTCFRVANGEVSNEVMMSLLVVADQYKLNPFTREIFAFEDKHKGIVPVVSVDGWTRIINEHPQLDGIEFDIPADGSACTAIIYRKDRNRPIKVTEYLIECKRDTGPWKSHPRRMLRHKSLIQGARVAFGFAGIYDEDEAERIVEARNETSSYARRSAAARESDVVDAEFTSTSKSAHSPAAGPAASDKPEMPAEKFAAEYEGWKKLVLAGKKKPADIIAMVSQKWALTLEQHAAISELDGVSE